MVPNPAVRLRVNATLRSGRWALGVRLGVLSGLLAFGLGAALPAPQPAGLGEAPEFLPVDEAFVLSTELDDDGALLAYWDMPEGYYLYRHRFDFTLREGDVATLGPPEIHPASPRSMNSSARWRSITGGRRSGYRSPMPRACSRSASPTRVAPRPAFAIRRKPRWVILNAVGSAAAAAPALASGDPTGSPNDAADGDSASSGLNADDSSTSSAVFAAAPETGAALPPPATEERRLASLLAERGWLLAAALFFLGGIGLAFTPCVLPMVPILSSIIISSKGGPDSAGGDLTRRRAFGLSLAYVLGMAFTYAAIGTLMGLFGASLNLQAALQAAASAHRLRHRLRPAVPVHVRLL